MALLLMLVMSGCATVGDPMPTTFNERAAAALATVTGIRQSATALVGQGKITPDDAQNVLTQTDAARTGIDIARKLHTSNPTAGDARLSATVTALQALQTYLQARAAK
jgi:hypothetical protein